MSGVWHVYIVCGVGVQNRINLDGPSPVSLHTEAEAEEEGLEGGNLFLLEVNQRHSFIRLRLMQTHTSSYRQEDASNNHEDRRRPMVMLGAVAPPPLSTSLHRGTT